MGRHHRPRSRWWPASWAATAGAAVAFTSASFVSGGTTSYATAPVADGRAVSVPTPAATSTGTAVPGTTARPASLDSFVRADRATARPNELSIPGIDARLRVTPVGTDARSRMSVPSNPAVAGWYRFGAGPSDPAGATVLAAHVNSASGPGPLSRLAALHAGERMHLRLSDGSTREYEVTDVRRYPKTSIDLASLFSTTGPARLHVVSCGGSWDPAARSFTDNVVAVAVPVGTRGR